MLRRTTRTEAKLGEDDLEELTQEVLTWTAQHGLLMRMDPKEDPTEAGAGLVHVPVSLLPVMPVPRDLFDQVCDIAKVFNTLVETVASRPQALKGTLALAAANDTFTKSLVDIYNKVLSGPRPWVANASTKPPSRPRTRLSDKGRSHGTLFST